MFKIALSHSDTLKWRSFFRDKSQDLNYRPDERRALYEQIARQYSLVSDEEEEKRRDYEDEYDDTYDANLIGAEDADSADELTQRRFGFMQIYANYQSPMSKAYTETKLRHAGNFLLGKL